MSIETGGEPSCKQGRGLRAALTIAFLCPVLLVLLTNCGGGGGSGGPTQQTPSSTTLIWDEGRWDRSRWK